MLLYGVQISISRRESVDSLEEFSLEFLTKQGRAGIIWLQYFFLPLTLLLFDIVDFLLFPQFTVNHIF